MAQNSGVNYPTQPQQFQRESIGTEVGGYNPVIGVPAYSQQAPIMQVAYLVGYAMAQGYTVFTEGYPVAPAPPEELNTALIAGSTAAIIAVVVGCCCALVVLIDVPFIVCLAFFPGEGRAKKFE